MRWLFLPGLSAGGRDLGPSWGVLGLGLGAAWQEFRDLAVDLLPSHGKVAVSRWRRREVEAQRGGGGELMGRSWQRVRGRGVASEGLGWGGVPVPPTSNAANIYLTQPSEMP